MNLIHLAFYVFMYNCVCTPKRVTIDAFSLDDEVHFLSWLYTSSVLSIQNNDLNDVLLLLSVQFLFIVSTVAYCYHHSAS